MHPCIMFFKWNQLGTHHFLVYLFQLLHMFRATMCPSSGELTVPMRNWYFSHCVCVAVWSAGWDPKQQTRQPPIPYTSTATRTSGTAKGVNVKCRYTILHLNERIITCPVESLFLPRDVKKFSVCHYCNASWVTLQWELDCTAPMRTISTQFYIFCPVKDISHRIYP